MKLNMTGRLALPIHMILDTEITPMMLNVLTSGTFDWNSPTVRPIKKSPEFDSVVLHDFIEEKRVAAIVEILKPYNRQICYFKQGPRNGWKKIN